MRVLLTGSTGFVGNHVARRLLDKGHTVRALVRKGSESGLAAAGRCETVRGDVTDPESLKGAVEGCEAVIHLVGIIREFPSRGITFRRLHVEGARNVADAAEEAGIKRFVHMSALGARENAPTEYWSTKHEAEKHLKSKNLELTVFRPSAIIGPGGEFSALLKRMAGAPLTPVIGTGKSKMQPVSVSDVAELFARALEMPGTSGKTYQVGGPEVLTYTDMLRIAGEVLGKPVTPLRIPAVFVKIPAALLDRFAFWPITREQLKMLAEDSVADTSQTSTDFNIEFTPYREALAEAFG